MILKLLTAKYKSSLLGNFHIFVSQQHMVGEKVVYWFILDFTLKFDTGDWELGGSGSDSFKTFV